MEVHKLTKQCNRKRDGTKPNVIVIKIETLTQKQTNPSALNQKNYSNQLKEMYTNWPETEMGQKIRALNWSLNKNWWWIKWEKGSDKFFESFSRFDQSTGFSA